MTIHSHDFRVELGKRVTLSKWPANVKPICKSKVAYDELLEKRVAELSELQEVHYAPDRRALLLIFQGMDGAVKDGTIRHVMCGVNPQGCEGFSFKQPSAEELKHDCEEVLLLKVHPKLLRNEVLGGAPVGTKNFWHQRYRSIVDLERRLCANGTKIVKFVLHLSKDELRKRFIERIEVPQKNWKLSPAGIHQRKYWKDYVSAYEQCLGATASDAAPWYTVPADDKDNARLIVSRVLLDALEDLKTAYPKTDAKRRRALRSLGRSLA